jgi:lysophospholipase L1-like esterase
MRELKIVFFGDSIINGKGVPLYKTFVNMLSKSLEEEWGGKAKVETTMISRNGDTTRDALERLHYLFNTAYDIVVLQFGMNDCNIWKTEGLTFRVFKGSFRANLKEILVRLNLCHVGKIFVCTNHPSTKEGYSLNNSEYNDIIREVCKESKEAIIDMELAVEEEFLFHSHRTDHVLKDGVHLSEFGHQIYYNEIKPYLDEEITNLLKEDV